jgi:GNAT superfamily N-acetyltransferase
MENFKDLPNFRLFPYSCKYCAFWESLDFDDKTKIEDAERVKRKWFIDVGKEFGNCGFILYVNKKPAGFARYGPAKYFPTISKYRGLTPSDDAPFLACLYIAKSVRRKGIGERLFKKVASDLRNRGYKAVEAFARTSESASDNISAWYTSPLEFFLKMGFTVRNQKGDVTSLRKELC